MRGRAIRSGTVVAALAELEAADWSLAARIAAAIEHGSSGCWRSLSRPFRRSRTAQHTECSRDYGPRCLANLWQPALKAVGEDTLCLVELRGFEPLTPCTPSMRWRFTMLYGTPRRHTTAQVRRAAQSCVVGRREAARRSVPGKFLARPDEGDFMRATCSRRSSRPIVCHGGDGASRRQEIAAVYRP
jgi:hypothetical protein